MSNHEALKQLRVPFAQNQISYLPKGGIRLAYVGHAALTDRLLDVDPGWTWEPLSVGENGLPVLDECGGLWIRLTVCGVTRLGYGDAGQKKGGDAMKERIGDALRNAAMRFGAALDLWHKGDLHVDEEPKDAPQKLSGPRGVVAAVLDQTPPLDVETRKYIDALAADVLDAFKTGGQAGAFDRVEIESLESEQKVYLWSLLASNVRSAIKAERGLRIGAA